MENKIKALLEVRKKIKAKTPNFRRMDSDLRIRLSDKWRKPKGRDNKMRMRHKTKGHLVQPGYGGPKAIRGIHPKGLFEVMVSNVNELEGLDPKTQGVRIAAAVGNRKKTAIVEAAKKAKIWIFNPAVKQLEKKEKKTKKAEAKETKKEDKKAEAKKEDGKSSGNKVSKDTDSNDAVGEEKK